MTKNGIQTTENWWDHINITIGIILFIAIIVIAALGFTAVISFIF